MKSDIQVLTPLVLTSAFLALFVYTAQAENGYDYFSDRLSRDHRDAGDVDDWIERGSATVTASPRFEAGVRLAAWASGSVEEDSYEFAIASAIYYFEVPRDAQYIEILVRYRGESHTSNLDDYEDIAGRVWIRNTRREHSRRSYDDDENGDTLYGDTFVLRAKRRSETIKIAAAEHVNDGLLELHVVTDENQQIDIEYIDVTTYRRQPDVRVIHRYARDYRWRPWDSYTYLYFYDGPSYYLTDLGYYMRWSYPIYDHHYVSIRHAYRDYLHGYYRRYPRYHHNHYYYRSYPSYTGVRVKVNKPVTTRRYLTRWTGTHEATRSEYSRSRLSATRSRVGATTTQNRVRSLIDKQREAPALADRAIRPSTASRRRIRISEATKLNATVKSSRELSRPVRGLDSSSRRTSPNARTRKRYSSESAQPRTDYRTRVYNRTQSKTTTRLRSSTSAQSAARSNAERRARLSNRAQSATRRSSAAPSQRTSSNVKRTKSRTQSTTRSSSSSTSKSRASTTQRARSRSSSGSDDDDKKSSSNRSRSTQRTKRTRSRK